MAFCILKINSIKNRQNLKQSGAHHFRFTHPENADPQREALNEAYIDLKGDSIQQDWDQKIKGSEYYKTHKVRNNQILAYDVLVSYSPEASKWIDLESWKKGNEKWLQDTFGKNNVLSLVYHYDEASAKETGTIHGHAIVIPLDKNGKLNAAYYTGSKELRSALQDSYAEAMSIHGLERGIEHSGYYGESAKRFYARVKDAVEQPTPQQEVGESVEHYAERLKEAYGKERGEHVKENESLDEKIKEAKEAARNTPAKEKLKELNSEYSELLSEEQEILHEFGSWEKAISKAKEMESINEALDRYPDEEKADTLADNIEALLQWESERNRKKKEKEQEKEWEDSQS